MSQTFEEQYPAYYKVKGEEIYIKLEENRRIVIGLNFGGTGKCFAEWHIDKLGLENGVRHTKSNEREFIEAMLKVFEMKLL